MREPLCAATPKNFSHMNLNPSAIYQQDPVIFIINDKLYTWANDSTKNLTLTIIRDFSKYNI